MQGGKSVLERAEFLGDWTISREIVDRRAGQSGQFAGMAHFQAEGAAALRYAEEGQMRMGEGPVLVARRGYLWRFAQGRVAVCFEDGRDFHSFAPGVSGAGTDHPCGDDLYRVTYDFGKWPHWSARWEVCGPRKDYRMLSQYRRY